MNRNQKRRNSIVAAVIVAIGSATIAVTAAANAGQTPSAAAQAQAAVAQARVETRGWPAAKASAFVEGVRADQPAFLAPKAGMQPIAPGAVAAPQPKPRSGIMDVRQGPFSPQDFFIQNRYQTEIAGRWIVVYAGTIRSFGRHPAVGGVRMWSYGPDGFSDQIASPDLPLNGTTSLKVLSASKDVLSLITDAGRAVSLNLSTRSFG